MYQLSVAIDSDVFAVDDVWDVSGDGGIGAYFIFVHEPDEFFFTHAIGSLSEDWINKNYQGQPSRKETHSRLRVSLAKIFRSFPSLICFS